MTLKICNPILILALLLALLLASTHVFAQTESINTDRPDQSDGVFTIHKNKFQLEDGITLARKTSLNNFMLRFGLANSTEVRLLLDAGKEAGAGGLKPVTLSAKQRILQPRAIIPAITFVGYVSFERLASKDFQGSGLPFQLKLAFENEVSDRITLGYNVGTSDEFNALDLTFNFGFAPADRISTFVEYFSTLAKSYSEHNVDAGILFAVKPELQFDIAVGGSVDGADDRFFTTFGVSYIFR